MEKYTKQEKVITADGEILSDKNTDHYSPLKRGRGYNYKYKSSRIQVYLDNDLPACFTANETGRLFWLSKKIYSDSNLIAYRADGKITPYTFEVLCGIVGLSKPRFYSFMAKARKHKIIKEIEYSGKEFFCFSPVYFNSTHYIPLHLYIAWQDELNDCLPQHVIDWYLDWYESTKGNQKAASPKENAACGTDQTKDAVT
jgi:hypothetical protein